MPDLTQKPLITEIQLRKLPSDDFTFSHLYPFYFKNNITLICGDNGIGKSTFLEALAIHLGCSPEGGSRNLMFSTYASHLDYHDYLRVIKSPRQIRDVYFYRAESFYNAITALNDTDEMVWQSYGGKNLHQLSHGEAMKAFYQNRLGKNSLYIFDEPESSLSLANQIDFIEQILKLSRQGSQFIIATHSPILMSMPEVDLIRFYPNYYEPYHFFASNDYFILKNILDSKGKFLKDMLNYD